MSPEEIIIAQHEISSEFYYIMQGDCVVNFTDIDGKLHVAYNCLSVGHHFGEIGMMYKCNRTCTILSRNYSTLARMTVERYRNISVDFPLFKHEMQKYIYTYKDP